MSRNEAAPRTAAKCRDIPGVKSKRGREKKEERERRKMVNSSRDLASEAAVPML